MPPGTEKWGLLLKGDNMVTGNKKWVGQIRLITATSHGRTGSRNLAGINIRAYKMLLLGSLAPGWGEHDI